MYEMPCAGKNKKICSEALSSVNWTSPKPSASPLWCVYSRCALRSWRSPSHLFLKCCTFFRSWTEHPSCLYLTSTRCMERKKQPQTVRAVSSFSSLRVSCVYKWATCSYVAPHKSVIDPIHPIFSPDCKPECCQGRGNECMDYNHYISAFISSDKDQQANEGRLTAF